MAMGVLQFMFLYFSIYFLRKEKASNKRKCAKIRSIIKVGIYHRANDNEAKYWGALANTLQKRTKKK